MSTSEVHETTSNRNNSIQLLSAFFAATCIICFWVYRHALTGPFISDDSFFVIDLAMNHPLDWTFVANAFHPYSDLQYEMMSYGPLYLLSSRIEWELFGADPLGYHIVNVIVHAINATLLVAVMRGEGIDKTWALVGGAFFALHPANVEAVAWINQLRSLLALGFALGAILALRKHPGLSAALFAAGLLSKVSALFVLPVALTLYWCNRNDSEREPISARWLGVWIALGLFCTFPNFRSVSMVAEPSFQNSADFLRNLAAIGSHYIVMATTSYGVSAFHLPEPVRSWSNSWWLASVPIGLVLLWRIVGGFAHRRKEIPWWAGAATAFGMIPPIIPLYYGIADRYLYIILPGLLIASLLWWQEVKLATTQREALRRYVPKAEMGLLIATVLMIFFFANHSVQRAALWKHENRLLLDSANHYPNGGVAALVRSLIALEKGDIEAAIPELHKVVETDYYQYMDLFRIPPLAPFAGHPDIVKLRHHVAQKEVRRWEERGTQTQHQMRAVASAHFYLGDLDIATEKLEEALRRGGPHRDAILDDLSLIREAKRNRQATKSH